METTTSWRKDDSCEHQNCPQATLDPRGGTVSMRCGHLRSSEWRREMHAGPVRIIGGLAYRVWGFTPVATLIKAAMAPVAGTMQFSPGPSRLDWWQ
jgi:hypothetical protein